PPPCGGGAVGPGGRPGRLRGVTRRVGTGGLGGTNPPYGQVGGRGTQPVRVLTAGLLPLFRDNPTRYGPAPRTGTRSADGESGGGAKVDRCHRTYALLSTPWEAITAPRSWWRAPTFPSSGIPTPNLS